MGPNEARLRQTVQSMQDWDVNSSRQAWIDSAQNLDLATKNLQKAAQAMKTAFGPDSNLGTQGHAAFTHAANRSQERAEEMQKAATAIEHSYSAMSDGQAAVETMDSQGALQDPGPFTPNPADDDTQQMKQSAAHSQQVTAYHKAQADRESHAKTVMDGMDTKFDTSSATMKTIHGKPDTPPDARSRCRRRRRPPVPARPDRVSTTGSPGRPVRSSPSTTTRTSPTSPFRRPTRPRARRRCHPPTHRPCRRRTPPSPPGRDRTDPPAPARCPVCPPAIRRRR